MVASASGYDVLLIRDAAYLPSVIFQLLYYFILHVSGSQLEGGPRMDQTAKDDSQRKIYVASILDDEKEYLRVKL